MYTITRFCHASGFIHFIGAFFTTIFFRVYVSMSKSLSVSQIPLIKRKTVSVQHFLCFIYLKMSKKTFDTSFSTQMMAKIVAIEIIFKSHEPFKSYVPAKGQLISICLFGVFNSFPKTNKNKST